MSKLFMNADNEGVEIYEEFYDHSEKKYYFKYKFFKWNGKRFEERRNKNLENCRKLKNKWLKEDEG